MSSKRNQKPLPFNIERLLSINLIDFHSTKAEAKNIGAILPSVGDLSHELLIHKILEFYNRKSILLPFHAIWWKKSEQTGDYVDLRPITITEMKKDIVSFIMSFVQQNETKKAAINSKRKPSNAGYIW